MTVRHANFVIILSDPLYLFSFEWTRARYTILDKRKKWYYPTTAVEMRIAIGKQKKRLKLYREIPQSLSDLKKRNNGMIRVLEFSCMINGINGLK